MACSIPLLPCPTLTTVHPAGQQDSRTAGQPGDEGSASLGKEHHGFANRPLLMNSLAPGAGGGVHSLPNSYLPQRVMCLSAPGPHSMPLSSLHPLSPDVPRLTQEGLPHKTRKVCPTSHGEDDECRKRVGVLRLRKNGRWVWRNGGRGGRGWCLENERVYTLRVVVKREGS